MIKKIILLTACMAVFLMLLQPGVGVTNNTSGSTAQASISETISVTLSGGIVFSNLMPGVANQSATNNLTITIDPATNVVTNITQRGDATFECIAVCGVGTDNFTIDNLSYANTNDLASAINMSNVYVAGPFGNWTNIAKPTVYPGEVRISEYWLDVPNGQTAGTYQTALYINVSK